MNLKFICNSTHLKCRTEDSLQWMSDQLSGIYMSKMIYLQTRLGPLSINCIRGIVHNFIKNPNKQSADPRYGLPLEVTENKKRLLWKARSGNYTAYQIIAQVEMNISLSRVRQIFSADENLRWTRMKSKHPMTSLLHHQSRLQWVTGHVT